MRNWIATTKSGRTYESVNGGIRVSGEGYFPQPEIRTFPPDAIPGVSTSNGRIDWRKLDALPLTTVPVVGHHLYISTFGDAGWRISTPVESIRFLPE